MTVELTVAICTFGRPLSLQQTLATLAGQSWDGVWEVLIIDNDGGASARLQGMAALAVDLPVDLRVTVESRRGLAFARNRALAEARGDAIVFTDDDVNCMPGWLAAHGDALRDPSVMGTAGRILPILPESASVCFRTLYSSENGGPAARYDYGDEPQVIELGGALQPPFGANMAVRRDTARSLGGFRTELGWGQRMVPGEETDLCRRILSAGGQLLYVPSAVVEHRIDAHRMTHDYYVRWWRGEGRSQVFLDPPRGWVRRTAMAGRLCWSLAKDIRRQRRARRRRAVMREIRVLQRRSHSEGMLLELLGL